MRTLGLHLCLTIAAAAPAQTGAPGDADNFSTYSKEKSRALFTACDLDGDDRIEWYEANKTIVGIDSHQAFRRFDTNNDGKIQFDEFDAQFKERTDFGGRLLISDAARRRLPKGLSTSAGEHPGLTKLVASFDRNRDDRIDEEEWKSIRELLGTKGIGTDVQPSFAALDRDLSGSLSISELLPLAPVVTLLDAERAKARTEGEKLRPLPAELRLIDLDSNTLISLAELSRALARIHPSVARHAKQILEAVDSDHDGHLNGFEVGPQQPPATTPDPARSRVRERQPSRK